MKILIITQKVNKNDPVLGFFHGWIAELSKKFESIVTICLEKGEYNLSTNVRVLSLGKELGFSRLKYLINFYKFIWQERKNYDSVFVHMNQEYVLLGGIFWFFMGKKVYMWRNHHAGNIFTDIAAFFCTNVFCTSKFSYTAKYKKKVLMPVGINTEIFKIDSKIERVPKSILFLGRIAPIKRPDLLIDSLIDLKKEGLDFTASFVGDPLPKDNEYYLSLKNKVKVNNMNDNIAFFKAIPNEKTVYVYNLHSIFVNLSTSGMYDKTIFEAMACGCLVLASNNNLRGLIDDKFIFEEGNKKQLIDKIRLLLSDFSNLESESFRKLVVEKHSLNILVQKLVENMK